jgi:hypothetical protein
MDSLFYELYSQLFSTGVAKSRRVRWARHVARIGELKHAYDILVGKPEGKRPIGRSGHRWDENSRMDLREGG